MKKEFKVVIPDRLKPPADIEQKILGKNVKIHVLEATTEKEILESIKNCDGILAWHELIFDKHVLSHMRQCQAIVRVGAGFDNVDIAFAAQKKIRVCNVPDYGVNDVADHACGLLLSIYRNLSKFFQQSQKAEGWCWENAGTKRLTGQAVGIIGLGRIGTAMSLRMKAFGIRVIFYDPYIPRGVEKSLGLERKDHLDDLLAEADIITFHAPLTKETKNMADKTFFSKVKKGAVLINTARGGIIDLDALYDAFKSNTIWAAGFDVLSQEPPDETHKLIRAWQDNASWLQHRLLVTPHCAFYSPQAFEEMRRKSAQELKRIFDGEKPFNCVNAHLF